MTFCQILSCVIFLLWESGGWRSQKTTHPALFDVAITVTIVCRQILLVAGHNSYISYFEYIFCTCTGLNQLNLTSTIIHIFEDDSPADPKMFLFRHMGNPLEIPSGNPGPHVSV